MTSMSQEEWEKSVIWVGVVAGCVIRQNDAYLLVQEKWHTVYGLWNLPAGHVDKGSSIEDTAVREVQDETGFLVELIDKVGLYHESATSTVKHVFLAQIISGQLKVQHDELLDARWLSYQEIAELHTSGKLRGEWIWQSITTVNNRKPN
jgi:ADP-ribose pyrophosphatase YjhB (NUDIX family)